MFLDRELCIRKFTPKVGQFFDLLPQDVGRRISTFSHNIAHEGLLDDIQTVLESGRECEHEVSDQRGQWHLLRVLPYRGKSGMEGAVITIVDVSTLKRTEQQLRRMSKVFMDGADAIIIEDLSGNILDANHEAERAYGWKRDQLLGKSFEVLVPASHRAISRRMRNRCRNAEHLRNVETCRVTKAGETIHVLLTLSLLTDEAGQPVAIATIAKDITRLKNAERQAQEAVRRRDQFLAMLSHELRNPLLESVFDLFVQTRETLQRDDGGMGVGLTLVRQLVQLHGGQVRAFSEGPGKGSEFVVRFPLSAPATATLHPATPTESATGGSIGRRVLIVEDNGDSRPLRLRRHATGRRLVGQGA